VFSVDFRLSGLVIGRKILSFFFFIYFSSISIPIYVKHNIQFREGSNGRFELTVGPKQTMGKTVRLISFIKQNKFLFSSPA
jgi:hypothetical protein